MQKRRLSFRNMSTPRKLIVLCIILLVILLVALIIINVGRSVRIKAIEDEIFKMPSQKFKVEEYDAVIDKLNAWVEEPISDSAKGVAYSRLTYFSSQKGDRLGQFTNFGKAVFYLEAGEDYEDEINSYCDISHYSYIATGSLDLAKEIMDRVDDIIDKHGLNNSQIQAIVARQHSILSYYDGEYENAIAYAKQAKKVVTDVDAPYYATYIMGADMLAARAYTGKGEFSKAKKILDEYRDSELFTFEYNLGTINAVCLIPYYQTLAYCQAHSGNEQGMLDSLDQIIQRSQQYDFEYASNDTVTRLKNDFGLSEETLLKIKDREMEVYLNYARNESDDFNNMCNAVIDSNYQNVAQAREHQRHQTGITIFISMLAIFLAVLSIVLNIIFQRGRHDALTGIGNRRAFDKALAAAEGGGGRYAIMMFDLDDFKHINDEFGHVSGDHVLADMGLMLKKYDKNVDIDTFRYGGEEFAVIVHGGCVSKAGEIAEEIRSAVENTTLGGHAITVSGGIGFSDYKDVSGKSVLEVADANLYRAKEEGKNRVVL